MNLQRLFEIQGGLDAHIEKEKGLEGKDLLPQKILALQVELGELANEWRGFKFWKIDPTPNTKCPTCHNTSAPTKHNRCPECGGYGKNPLLEEYVDCLHFILSIGIELGQINRFKVIKVVKEENITNQFRSLFFLTVGGIPVEYPEEWFNPLISAFLDLGEMLGFTEDEIESAYLDKNRINHERQINGY